MSLPSSGLLSILASAGSGRSIRAEWSPASGGYSLLAYLKNAGIVSSSDTAPNVPTSAPIRISQFYSAAKASGSLSASADPTYANGSGDGTYDQTVVTDSVTVTATGGTLPYSYLWTKVSGNTFTILDDVLSSTMFARYAAIDMTYSAIYRCTVTDSASATTYVDVSVYVDNPSG